jgi:NTE family protein
MAGLSTATLFRDVVRQDVPPRRKADDAFNYVGPEIGLRDGSLALPKGAVAGVALEAVLRRLTVRQESGDFDRLPIPFRAVATDLATSDMVVLRRGNLALAVRASMAIPAAVNPVELDGRLFVDGGAVRNLPVDVARAMGADVVIAVNIGTPLLQRDQITSLLSVTDQMLRIMTSKNVNQSLAELGPQDVLITPDLKDVASGDFDRLEQVARAGEAAGRAASQLLGRYSIDEPAYAALLSSRAGLVRNAGETIAAVRVTGTQRVNPETIVAAMHSAPGESFDARTADEDMRRLYGRGDFERVSYSFNDDPGQPRVLTADVTEKSWGPSYLRFGLGMSTDFEGNAIFNLVATTAGPGSMHSVPSGATNCRSGTSITRAPSGISHSTRRSGSSPRPTSDSTVSPSTFSRTACVWRAIGGPPTAPGWTWVPRWERPVNYGSGSSAANSA